MGEWVVREAAAQLARWSAEGLPLVPVAVNVSSRQCADMAIVGTIRHALAESRLDPRLLKIEADRRSTAMHKRTSSPSCSPGSPSWVSASGG